jgi:fumarate reductase flavoprotein subunit
VKTKEADLVVIAAGTAGLPAAVTAAEGGASVIVLEKRSFVGGAGNVGSMIIGVNSRLSKSLGITLTSAELFKIHMDYTHWRADARLVKAFYDNTGPTIDWLEKQGVEFSGIMGAHGRSQYPVTHGITGGTHILIRTLEDRAKEMGVEILLNTAAQKILKEKGRITGVIARNVKGEEVKIKAKAVVVATGGFGANKEMVREYTGYDLGKDIFSFRISGITGDGLRMAWEAGAAKTNMIMQLIFSLPQPYHGPVGTSFDFMALVDPSAIMVNLNGERFLPEDSLSDTTFGGNAIALQPKKVVFSIIDEDIRAACDAKGVGMFPGGDDNKRRSMAVETERFLKEKGRWALAKELKITGDETTDVLMRRAQEKGYKYLHIADSLDELCEITGIDPAGFKATLAEYDRFCEDGCDAVFAKAPEYLRPIKKPPFYVAQLYPSAYGTLGGIKINYKTEVLNENSWVIPGLYAAGVDANAIYGDSYTRFLGGNTQGFAVTSGHMAGQSVLNYLQSQ